MFSPEVNMRLRRTVGLAVLLLALMAAAILPDDRALLDASRRGDVAAVRSLLKEGADPNSVQGDGLTALHLAAQTGNLEVVRVLLRAGARVDAQTRIGAHTPLHLASQGAHSDVVKALLSAHADVAAITTTSGVTPLHLAAAAIHGEVVVKELLEAGAPVDAIESVAGQTPLMFAASAGRAEAVRELLRHGADPGVRTKVFDVLQRIVVDREAKNRLREAQAAIRKTLGVGTTRALTPTEMQAAITAQREFLRSDEQIAKQLEGFKPEDLWTRQPFFGDEDQGFKSIVMIDVPPMWETWVQKTGGMTALLHAAREGSIGAAEALLDGGADVDQVSADGSSPLVLALENGRYDLAMLLIRRGANPSLANDAEGASPLFALLQTQWTGNFLDEPLGRAYESQQTAYLDVLTALLEAGADPNIRLKRHPWYWEFTTGSRLGLDLTGATPFWRAAFAQDVDAMKMLVAHGADPDIPTVWPMPGMRLRRQQDGRQGEDSGFPIMPEGTPSMYPIHAASGGGWLGVGAYMVNGVPQNFLNAVKYLVEEQSADVDLPDSWGYTPLHYAAVRGGNDLIEYLVSKGADVHALSRLGQSSADMARGGNGGYFERPAYPESVRLLQSLGAPLLCFSTHFRGTGDYCAGSGQPPFERDPGSTTTR